MRPLPTKPAPPPVDAPTLLHAAGVLEERLKAVVAYGAGGCPTCHDSELRAAIVKLRELAAGVGRP